MVAEVKEIRSVSKRAIQWFDMDKFNLEKPNMEVREQHQFEILNISAALENLINSGNINTAWGKYQRNNKI
jgi:hypothetical protein